MLQETTHHNDGCQDREDQRKHRWGRAGIRRLARNDPGDDQACRCDQTGQEQPDRDAKPSTRKARCAKCNHERECCDRGGTQSQGVPTTPFTCL